MNIFSKQKTWVGITSVTLFALLMTSQQAHDGLTLPFICFIAGWYGQKAAVWLEKRGGRA